MVRRAAAPFLLGCLTFACGGSLAAAAATHPHSATPADAYPHRPIRAIVGFPPGNATDMLARLIGGKLGEQLGQPVVVDNRPGANGIIAAQVTANAARDGHTLLFMSASHTMNAAVNRLPFDAVDSFSAVTMLGEGPLVLVAYPAFPARSVKTLIASAASKPNTITYASVGAGGINHFAAALLSSMTRITLIHVPYKGGAPALNDVMAGHVQLMFGTLPLTLGPLQSGKINALAVTGAQRTPLLPQVPTVAESGVPGYEIRNWWGVLGPAGLPPRIVAKLNAAIAGVLARRESVQRLEAEGIVPSPLTSSAFSRVMANEVERWRRVARDADIRVD